MATRIDVRRRETCVRLSSLEWSFSFDGSYHFFD